MQGFLHGSRSVSSMILDIPRWHNTIPQIALQPLQFHIFSKKSHFKTQIAWPLAQHRTPILKVSKLYRRHLWMQSHARWLFRRDQITKLNSMKRPSAWNGVVWILFGKIHWFLCLRTGSNGVLLVHQSRNIKFIRWTVKCMLLLILLKVSRACFPGTETNDQQTFGTSGGQVYVLDLNQQNVPRTCFYQTQGRTGSESSI